MGNRGILHDDQGTLGRARWKHKAWVTCVLKHKDWHRKILQPGHYTELFFLDEAVALAAGHRPCAMCRHRDYLAYRRAAGARGTAKVLDDQLHRDRAIKRTFLQRRVTLQSDALPDGAIILDDDGPKLVQGARVYPVAPDGYRPPEPRRSGEVTVLTPKTSLKALEAGYRPQTHASLIERVEGRDRTRRGQKTR